MELLAATIAESIKNQLDDNSCWTKANPNAPPTSEQYLIWMCEQIICNPDWPEDKAHRWVGFIQGVLVATGTSNLDAERDRVRLLKEKNNG